MTYIEPTPPGAPQPEVDPTPSPVPEITPDETPHEVPPLQPGGGGPGDSRPHDHG
ncbi:MAG TPA: hypothetical protein PLQ03_11900 [Brevundimonas sp.]|uniref:hypothetical protein n=1 Tax=Brevundimonas sp. TaxID=1871086 RepID=UPI00262E994F|nr:hypothetical protein [Brevundimonas sp.]HRO34101.1 hypothetical protein [Brevundimonas sp.]